MKKAAKIMYTLGIIGNFCLIFVCLIGMLISLIGVANIEEIIRNANTQFTEEQIAAVLAFFTSFTIVYLIIYIVTVILAFVAKSKVNDGKKSYFPHILVLVIGVVGWNVFYILGGIFGIVAETQEKKKND